MGILAMVFALVIGLWWGRVVLALGAAYGAGQGVALVMALVALAVTLAWAREFVARGVGVAAQGARGFTALGLSLGLGALPLAVVAISRGEAVGASAAAGASNPFGTIFGVPLAPILAGNLMAGVVMGAAAVAALACLLLAGVFATFSRR